MSTFMYEAIYLVSDIYTGTSRYIDVMHVSEPRIIQNSTYNTIFNINNRIHILAEWCSF